VTIRAFIAVELDDGLRREIARVQEHLRAAIESGHARVAWVRPASMHVTLKFLGDIDDAIVPELHASIATSTRDIAAIELPLVRLGAFPRLQEPRNVWLGPDEPWTRSADANRLQSLARAIDESCAAHGLQPEARRFSPHLTLGRVKAGERQIGRALASHPGVTAPLPLAPLVVSEVALMKSQLDSKGAVHTRLWQVPLAGVS
jgi:2'-5' RNA ligase